MSAYPSIGVVEVADFAGVDFTTLDAVYITQSVLQSFILFAWLTGRTDRDSDWPDTSSEAELAQLGVTALAYSIYLSQKYASVKVSPFQSETIGSYSYSRASAQRALVLNGESTGVDLFDLAVKMLALESVNSLSSDSMQVFTDKMSGERLSDGTFKVLGPSDVDPVDYFGFSYSVPITRLDG